MQNKSKLFVGFELEFLHCLSDLPFVGPFGHLKSDGSIKATAAKGGYPREFASRIARGDTLLSQVTSVCDALKASQSYSNRSCGFHVHIDMRTVTASQRKQIEYWWFLYEPIFFAMVRQQRRKNTYCTSVKLEGRFRPEHTRYQALNTSAYSKHKSYEFRLHHGTVNSTLIRKWILLLLRFVTKAIAAPVLITDERLTGRQLLISFYRFLDLPLKGRKYVIRRIRRFERYVRITEYIQLSKEGTPQRVQHQRLRV